MVEDDYKIIYSKFLEGKIEIFNIYLNLNDVVWEVRVVGIKVENNIATSKPTVYLFISYEGYKTMWLDWWLYYKKLSFYPANSMDFICE